MKYLFFCIVLVFLVGASHVWGAATDREFMVEYFEPTENVDFTPLDDLAGTRIYTDVIGDGLGRILLSILATAKTGGGKITQEMCIAVLDDATAEHIDVFVTAFDKSGNESPPSSPTIVWPFAGTPTCSDPLPPVPDTIPPAMPQNVQIR